MRRQTRRRLLWLLLIPALLVAGRPDEWFLPLPRWLKPLSPQENQVTQTQPGVVYISAGEWLDFPLSGGGEMLKVLSNATLSALTTEEGLPYVLEYRLVNADGEILSHRYHHRTRLTGYQEPGGRTYYRNLYREPGLHAADGQMLLINLRGLPRPERLLMRLGEAHPAIRDVALRVYEQQQVSSHREGILWLRLSAEKQAYLARGNVHGPHFLTQREQENLLRHYWKPLGPVGLAGRDFQTRYLFQVDESAHRGQAPPPPAAGLYVSAWHSGVIALPAQAGTLHLVFMAPAGGTPAAQTLHGEWYGDRSWQRETWQVPTGNGEYRRAVHGGLLVLHAQQPLVMQAFFQASDTDEQLPLDFAGRRLPAYLARPGEPVVFRSMHLAGQATPLRLDLRLTTCGSTACSPDEAQRNPGGIPGFRCASSGLHSREQQAQVTYHWLDTAGRIIRRGELNVRAESSRYDHLRHAPPDTPLSEAVRYFFTLPPEVAEIRIEANPQVLVSAYNRPPDLPLLRRVPEDYQSRDPDVERRPAWFPLYPEDKTVLAQQQRVMSLALQPRPPEDAPEIQAGRYHWESYDPQGHWLGRPLLLPRDDSLPLRDSARKVAFRELAAGVTHSLELAGIPGRRQISPTLLYLRASAQATRVRVWLDGKLHLDRRIAGHRGELSLPTLSVGRHRLRLEAADSARWFINHADAATWLKRLVPRVRNGRLYFEYQKTTAGKEVLSARLQVPFATRTPAQVAVRIHTGPRPITATGWTVAQRHFTLTPDHTEKVAVLNTRDQWLDSGRPFFITLDTDLAPGTYPIDITLDTAAEEAYLLLYRLIPGAQPSRKMFYERW